MTYYKGYLLIPLQTNIIETHIFIRYLYMKTGDKKRVFLRIQKHLYYRLSLSIADRNRMKIKIWVYNL
jgi:hypothetical protein